MSKGAVLGGGLGCFTWVGLVTLTCVAGMGLMSLLGIKQEALDGVPGVITSIVVGVSTFIWAWHINQSMEKKWAEEKAEAARKENAAHARRLERDRQYYRENPERLVTDICPMCNMVIPAFAQICPYCRSNLREES